MSKIHFEPIAQRTTEIVETVMALPEIVALPDQAFSMRLVVEELVSNVVNYSTSPMIQIEVQRLDRILQITIIDQGIPFNPLLQDAPNISLDAKERPIGGLGIYLVRQLMSRIHYSYEDHTNVLTIEKDL